MKYNAVDEYFNKAYIRLSSYDWHLTQNTCDKIVLATVIDNDAFSLRIQFIPPN